MQNLEKFAEDLKKKIEKASIGRDIKPTILFCGCNSQLKKDMHRRSKRIGLIPSYSMKHPTIKVELQNNRRVETDKFQTTIMDYYHFEFICQYLER